MVSWKRWELWEGADIGSDLSTEMPSDSLVTEDFLSTCDSPSGMLQAALPAPENQLCTCMCAQSFSPVQLFVTPWTVARQAPQSMEFSRQEYWSGLPFPTPENFPNPEIEPAFLATSALQVDSLPLSHRGSQLCTSLSNSQFSNIKLVAWNQWFLEYMHQRNWQALQIRVFFILESWYTTHH